MKDIVGEPKVRRKKRLRVLSAIGAARRQQERREWAAMHQNNNTHTRQTPSLAPITIRVVDWDVKLGLRRG